MVAKAVDRILLRHLKVRHAAFGAGGHGTALGTGFAAILLILMVTIMQILSMPRGTQDLVQGAVVILVLALAARGPERRGARTAAAT